MTILREWRGRAAPDKVDAVLDHYVKNLKPTMTAVPGFMDASFGRRDLGGVVEFILVTRWRDMASVEAFAGPAPEKAVLPHGTKEVLADTDTFVRLYEIVDQA
ncbi:MAG: antibiotic biosynthesis monooxygenase [Amphiplicatus sp.]